MDLDFGTLCLLGIFLVVGLMLLPRLLRGFGAPGGSPYAGQGDETPQYDDPDIGSRGGFGGSGRRGIFGGGRSGGGLRRGGGVFGGGSRRNDSPNIRSRGGFGGNKR